jgi:hypothetical protein
LNDILISSDSWVAIWKFSETIQARHGLIGLNDWKKMREEAKIDPSLLLVDAEYITKNSLLHCPWIPQA